MKRLNFAIIGCGRIAERHAKQIATYGKLVAVCDVVQQKASQLGNEYQAATYIDYKQILQEAKADVVVICTPNGLHAMQAIEALEAGFHVLVEKPMAISSGDCKAMMAAAEKANRRLFVVKQNRYNPPVAAVKQLLDSGQLGELYSAQINCYWNRPPAYYNDGWRGTKELDGGTLYTQFSHFVDLLYWMFGDVDNITAFTGNYAHKKIICFEDCGIVNMKMNNGMLAALHYTVNSFSKNMEGSITLFSEKATVKIGGEYLNTLEYQATDGLVIDVEQKPTQANDYGFYQGSMSNHHKVYQHLAECLSGDAAFETNAFEAYKAVEIIERIYAAAVNN